MQDSNGYQLKKIRPYALAALPFIALFAYQLATVLPHRPFAPDIAHGYTIQMGEDDKTVYVSTGDCVRILAPWLCAVVLVMVGAWKAGMFRRLFRR